MQAATIFSRNGDSGQSFSLFSLHLCHQPGSVLNDARFHGIFVDFGHASR